MLRICGPRRQDLHISCWRPQGAREYPPRFPKIMPPQYRAFRALPRCQLYPSGMPTWPTLITIKMLVTGSLRAGGPQAIIDFLPLPATFGNSDLPRSLHGPEWVRCRFPCAIAALFFRCTLPCTFLSASVPHLWWIHDLVSQLLPLFPTGPTPCLCCLI